MTIQNLEWEINEGSLLAQSESQTPQKAVLSASARVFIFEQQATVESDLMDTGKRSFLRFGNFNLFVRRVFAAFLAEFV